MSASGAVAPLSNPAIPLPAQSPIVNEEEIDVPKPCCTRTLCGKITCGPTHCLSSAVKIITFIGAVYFGVTEMTAAAVLSGVAFGASVIDGCVNRIDFSKIATALKEQNRRFRTSLATLKLETTQLNEHLKREIETNRQVSQALETQKRLVTELQATVSQLRQQEAQFREVARDYEARVANFNQQLDTFKQKLEQMPALIASIQSTNHQLDASIGKVHDVLNPLLRELVQLVDTLRDSFRTVMETLQKEKRDLEAEQFRLADENTRLKQDAENFETERRRFSEVEAAYQKTDSELSALRDSMVQERQKLEEERKELEAATSNLEKERAALAGVQERLDQTEVSLDLSAILQKGKEQEEEIQKRLEELEHGSN